MTHNDSQDWNLDDGISDSFEFKLGGHLYKMRYPTTQEQEDMAKLADYEKIFERILEFVVAPEGAPPIKEAIAKSNVKQGRKFAEMIKQEIGA